MTQAKQEQDHYEGVPGAKKGRALVAWQDFEAEVKTREQEIASMLPGHVSRARFINTAISAVKQTPELLLATPRSLFGSITKAAQDGLLPDGREGVITVYNSKVPGTQNYEKVAQWNPMIGGLRRRARELDHLIIDAQVVYEKDHFVWHQGDEPRIEHTPAKLGTVRGDKIGAYAIFKREDGTILHREVMDAPQIETTRKQSKAQDSLMWTKFAEEGYRKAVVRRGFKSVPVSENLEQIVKRDDDLFDFDQDKPHLAIVPPPAPKANGKSETKASEFDAKAVADSLVQAVNDCEAQDELTKWEDTAQEDIIRVQKADIGQHERVMDAIQTAYERLNGPA